MVRTTVDAMKSVWNKLKHRNNGDHDHLQVPPIPQERAVSEEHKERFKLSPRIRAAFKMKRCGSENDIQHKIEQQKHLNDQGKQRQQDPILQNACESMAREERAMQWRGMLWNHPPVTSPRPAPPPFPEEAFYILPTDSVTRVVWKVSKYGYDLKTFSILAANTDMDGLAVCSMHPSDVDALALPENEKEALRALVQRSKIHPEECAVSLNASSTALYRVLSVVRGLVVSPTLLHNQRIDGMEFCSPLSRRDLESFGVPDNEINALLLIVLRSVPSVFKDNIPVKLTR